MVRNSWVGVGKLAFFEVAGHGGCLRHLWFGTVCFPRATVRFILYWRESKNPESMVSFSQNESFPLNKP